MGHHVIYKAIRFSSLRGVGWFLVTCILLLNYIPHWEDDIESLNIDHALENSLAFAAFWWDLGWLLIWSYKKSYRDVLLCDYYFSNAETSISNRIVIETVIAVLFLNALNVSYFHLCLVNYLWAKITSAKFWCRKQHLNVKLVIKNQMCWHSSHLKSDISLSFSPLSFWMDFIIFLYERTISQCACISLFNYILKYFSYAQKHIDCLPGIG